MDANDAAGDWKVGGTGTLEQPDPFWHPIAVINDGDLNRPLTSAAHELGHALGMKHAGTSDGLFNTSCDGDTGGQEGEFWPQDQAGRLRGTEFDGTSAAPPARVTPRVDDNGNTRLYDLMSYCFGQEANAWLSARNWAHALTAVETYKLKIGSASAAASRSVASAASVRGGGFAVGVIGPAGTRIERVVPRVESKPPAPPDSPLRLRSLDAAGRTLADVGVQQHGLVTHDASAGASFIAPVPAGAASVELVRDGQVLDGRRRSAAPHVRLLAPRRGGRVRRGGRGLLVRWSARDRDHDPLYATVDYSPDGGRSWTSVFQGPSTGHARIPAGALAAGRHARIRVAVNDGFNEPRVTSPAFTAEGSPPLARIVQPRTGDPLRSDGRILLAGSAFDDRHHELPARALTWYAGRKRLGYGRNLTVRLSAGRHTLRIVARDRLRRVGVERIRASERSMLRAAHRRYSIGTHTKRIRLPLPRHPKSGVLRIPCTLTAAGGREVRGAIVLNRHPRLRPAVRVVP